MSKEIIRNVVIKDGNRTVNWDFKAERSVRDILQERGFEWEPGSVKVCGKPFCEDYLDWSLLKLYGFVFWGGNLVISMVPKKKEPKKKEEVDAE